MAFVHVPTARAHHQRGGLVAQRIALARRRVGEVDLSRPAVLEVRLALDQVGEDRRGRVLEIGHEHFGAGIQRVDDHLAIDRAGDLDAAVEKIRRDRGDLPVALADRAGLGQEIGQFAGVEALLPLGAQRQQFEPARVEAAMQLGEEGERVGAEDFVMARSRRGAKLDGFFSRSHGKSPGAAPLRGEGAVTTEKPARWGAKCCAAKRKLVAGRGYTRMGCVIPRASPRQSRASRTTARGSQ